MSFHSKLDLGQHFGQFNPEEIRTQYAALCYRIVDGKVQVLLITSRGTKRWIVPKGWPMSKKAPHQAALQEAKEEAGVIGRAHARPIGTYTYTKLLDTGEEVPCVGLLFPVHVQFLRAQYPEARERKRKWYSRKKASRKVMEPDLALLIRDFDPSQLD